MTPDEARRIASDLLRDAVGSLRAPPPPSKPPKGSKRSDWRLRWQRWERERIRDLRFFRDPARSAVWCEAAGVDYEAVVERLEAEGIMYDPKDVYPLSISGKPILGPKPPPSPKNDNKAPVTCECGRICKGPRALKIHKARGCIGKELARICIAKYEAGEETIERIVERAGVSEEALYKLLRDRDVDMRRSA